jgi:adenylate cyclase
MRVITYVEVYTAKRGRWAMLSRGMEKERARALDTARELSNDSSIPTLVLEDRLDMETGDTHVEVIFRSNEATPDIKAPELNMDVTSRVFMTIVTAFGIGAVATVIAAVLFSSAQTSSSYGTILLMVFGVSTFGSGLFLLKQYVPMDLILWRRKTLEARQRTVQALNGKDSPGPGQSLGPSPVAASPPSYKKNVYKTEPRAAAAPAEVDADMEQTSFQISGSDQQSTEDAEQPTDKSTAETTAASAEPEDEVSSGEEDTLTEQREQLAGFAQVSFADVTAARPQLQAFERFGVNLYIGGAAGALAAHHGLNETVKLSLLQNALERIGTNSDSAKSFCERLNGSAQRPRYRKLMDAGHAAMKAQLNQTKSRQPPLPDLIGQWAERTEQSAQEQVVTFLLTDIVGSTALTSKLGNSGAQRIVRAHNAVVRAAIKEYKGTEVKHTGDGLLATFPDPAAAVRAAMEIQQDALAYALDNPDAPLELRVGVHTGIAGLEDGEYFGETVLLLDGVCDAAETGHIACSPDVQSKCVGSAFQFTHMGEVEIKGSAEKRHLFKAEWTPKSRAPKGELEYRQLGTRPTAGTD